MKEFFLTMKKININPNPTGCRCFLLKKGLRVGIGLNFFKKN